VIKTTKCPSWVVPTHTLQIQDGGRDLDRGLTDFDEIWHGDADLSSWPSRPLKFWNFKNPRWRRPPSRKIEKSPYLGRGLTDCDDIWKDDAVRPSRPFRPLKIWNFKNPKSRYLDSGLTDRHEIWHGGAIRHLRCVPQLEICNFKNPTWRQPWKIEKSPYVGRSFSDFNEIWQSDAVWPSWPFGSLQIKTLKISMMAAANILKN